MCSVHTAALLHIKHIDSLDIDFEYGAPSEAVWKLMSHHSIQHSLRSLRLQAYGPLMPPAPLLLLLPRCINLQHVDLYVSGFNLPFSSLPSSLTDLQLQSAIPLQLDGVAKLTSLTSLTLFPSGYTYELAPLFAAAPPSLTHLTLYRFFAVQLSSIHHMTHLLSLTIDYIPGGCFQFIARLPSLQ
jgi:hypothetical protein